MKVAGRDGHDASAQLDTNFTRRGAPGTSNDIAQQEISKMLGRYMSRDPANILDEWYTTSECRSLLSLLLIRLLDNAKASRESLAEVVEDCGGEEVPHSTDRVSGCMTHKDDVPYPLGTTQSQNSVDKSLCPVEHCPQKASTRR